MKPLRLAALGAGIAAVVLFAGIGRPDRASGDSPATTPVHTISVTGAGIATATPDQAGFSFGVTTRGQTAAQALAANSTAMRKLIDALKAAGIPDASLQTTYVSLSPVTSDSGDQIVGYTASNSVSATIASIAKAGQIVDVAVAAGANQVDGPNLTVSDQTALYGAALKAAVADARAKAEVLAEASGLHVGAVASVVENGSSSPVVFDAAKAAPSAGTPIQAGTQQISASVTVVFEAS